MLAIVSSCLGRCTELHRAYVVYMAAYPDLSLIGFEPACPPIHHSLLQGEFMLATDFFHLQSHPPPAPPQGPWCTLSGQHWHKIAENQLKVWLLTSRPAQSTATERAPVCQIYRIWQNINIYICYLRMNLFYLQMPKTEKLNMHVELSWMSELLTLCQSDSVVRLTVWYFKHFKWLIDSKCHIFSVV